MVKQFIVAVLLGLVWIGLAAVDTPPMLPEPTENPPSQETIKERLSPPPMPDNPTQADFGAQVYYQVCMACHGDRGQGLTKEWRAVWEEDSNCWKSECHAPNHPPQGFEIPKTCCKAVLGPTALVRFDNAQELHTYLEASMPWWNPGYLKPEEYWQLTAFLLRAQDVLPIGVTLDETNASVFHLHPATPLQRDPRPGILLLSLILALAGGVLVVAQRTDRR